MISCMPTGDAQCEGQEWCHLQCTPRIALLRERKQSLNSGFWRAPIIIQFCVHRALHSSAAIQLSEHSSNHGTAVSSMDHHNSCRFCQTTKLLHIVSYTSYSRRKPPCTEPVPHHMSETPKAGSALIETFCQMYETSKARYRG